MFQIQLPITYCIQKDVPLVFKIHDIEYHFLSKKGKLEDLYDGLGAIIYVESDIKVHHLSPGSLEFYEHVESLVGPEVNRFYILLCQMTNNYFQNIYNGEDFNVPHRLDIIDENNVHVEGYDSFGVYSGLTKSTFDEILAEVDNKDENIVDHLYLDSQNFLEAGLLDMALLNAYVALEVCVKQKFNKSMFRYPFSSIFAEIKDFKFVEKYLVYGPTLQYGRSLKEEDSELYNKIILVDSIRNNIVHEGSLKSHKTLKGKQYAELYSAVDDMIDDIEDVIEWVRSLK